MIWFGSVNDTEASVFGYSGFSHFVQPLGCNETILRTKDAIDAIDASSGHI